MEFSSFSHQILGYTIPFQIQGEQTVCWQTFRSHPFCLCPFPSLFIYCRMCKQSHTLGKHSVNKPTPFLTFITASWWRLQWRQLSWHISLTFTSHLWWWTLIYISPILFMSITSFYMSVFCRVRWLSHTLGKTFSKVELSVDVHHP